MEKELAQPGPGKACWQWTVWSTIRSKLLVFPAKGSCQIFHILGITREPRLFTPLPLTACQPHQPDLKENTNYLRAYSTLKEGDQVPLSTTGGSYRGRINGRNKIKVTSTCCLPCIKLRCNYYEEREKDTCSQRACRPPASLSSYSCGGEKSDLAKI